MIRLLELARDMYVPAGALAQAWRNPCGRFAWCTATSDVIDASVLLVARLVDGATLTSDSDDLRRLDERIDLVPC